MRSVLGADIYCLTDEGLSKGRSNIEVVEAMLANNITSGKTPGRG